VDALFAAQVLAPRVPAFLQAFLAACGAGQGVAQLLEVGSRELLVRGELVNLFPAWSDEQFPVYALHPSRSLPPARLRAFLDFVVQSARGAAQG
jgi:DNA-binding transcriptional LysR family regulator